MAAQEDLSPVDDDVYLIDPDEDPEVVNGAAFDTPVVDTDSKKFLKAKKAFNADFYSFLQAKKAFGTDEPVFGNEEAADHVRKAYLKAKKAFSEGRQDVESAKKGDKSPVHNASSYFDDDA